MERGRYKITHLFVWLVKKPVFYNCPVFSYQQVGLYLAMNKFSAGSKNWKAMETEQGIFTQDGHWYRITREHIDEYVPGLLDIYTLEELLREAGYWASSSAAISLLLYVALIFISVNAWLAAISALGFYIFWYFQKSAFVYPALKWPVAVITNTGVIYIGMGAALTYFGVNELYAEAGLGFALFFLLKVGLLKLLLDRYVNTGGISLQDRVLNMILIRRGMKEGIPAAPVEFMEKELIKNMQSNRKKEQDS